MATKRHGTLDAPDRAELECLVIGLPGTVGEFEEQALVDAVHALCKKHGFGRVAQLVEAIDDIWRHPENAERHLKFKNDWIRTMTPGDSR